ncbi:MAG: glycoside hydrolase family 3 C-terminal domain-containing protein [Bacteroidales bacterium]|nr:glycoside hydrolase family 3 C-terminal domain-containing protein [Bacteroidales bacterium]
MKDLNKKTIQLILILFAFSTLLLKAQTSSLDKANELLSKMTLEEKIGQIAQVDLSIIKSRLTEIEKYCIGSILSGGDSKPSDNSSEAWKNIYDSVQYYASKTRLQIPVIYGIDAVHGNNSIKGAVIFPHNIGLGCTKNPELIEKIGRVTAIEIAATGINWNFGPCMAVAQDDRWGRTYESYSEDPELVSILSSAYIKGLQTDNLQNETAVAGTAKHFAADGATFEGKDRGDAIISETEFRKKHVDIYKSAIDLNIATIMASFSKWNGKECHGNAYLLDTILRQELGFEGVIVSDWGAIDLLPGDYYSDIVNGINSGLDLIMVPIQYEKFLVELKKAIENGDISIARIDNSVRRILKLKYDLGMFDKKETNRELLKKIGSKEHRTIGRQAVRESMVLLKNNNKTLPISKDIKKIHIAGSHADNIGYQCGGWTLSWQGMSGNITPGTSLLQAIKKTVPKAEISYSDNGEGADESTQLAIVAIGETPYAEWFGDDKKLMLQQKDIDIIENLKRKNIPVVCVLMTGRPRIITPIIHNCEAVVAAWLPGTEAEGITDILFGDYNPTGKLSFSWPKSIEQEPINIGDSKYDPLFAFGYGMTSFEDDLSMNPTFLTAMLLNEGNSIEILLSQKIVSLPGIESFKIMTDQEKTIQITSVEPIANNPYKLKLNLSEKIEYSSILSLTYTGQGLVCGAKKTLAAFENQMIYSIQYREDKINKAPGMIQAENYFNQQNITVTDGNDQLGGEKVILEKDEWIELFIDVDNSNVYDLFMRFYGVNKATLEVSVDNISFAPIKVPEGTELDWKMEAYKNIELTTGKHIVKLKTVEGTVHLNWLAFDTFKKIPKRN